MDDFVKTLEQGLEELGLQADRRQIEQLKEYMDFLLEENKNYNLTAIREPAEVIAKHFFDSLTLYAEKEISSKASVIDVGTGAGFPGLVLKIFLPEIKLVLLDSLAKRINFLQLLQSRLSLTGVETIHGRAEELGQEKKYREGFDWVVSRAVASLDILSEYTLPFARKGGHVVLYKGPYYKGELEAGERAINLLGGKIDQIKEVKVPGLEGERYLIFIKKITKTPSQYPRRPGIPKKRPL